MKVGISSACLYPADTIESLSALLENDVKHFEIFFNTISEIDGEYFSRIVSLLNEHHASVKSIHPFTSGYESYLLFTDYERRYRDTLLFYRKYFECAARLGAEIVVIHGDKKTAATGISDECYFEKFAELASIGKEYGITVAQENVNAFRSQNPNFVRKMREHLGNEVSFVLDIKQAVRAGNDPFDMCLAMGDRLSHVHINDNNGQSDCMLPFGGSTDYSRLFNILKENNYGGDMIIEVYRKNFGGISELIASYRKLKLFCENAFVNLDKNRD